jgi:hypothetical protein
VKLASILLALSLLGQETAAQSGAGSDVAQFIASAKAATARYRDQAAAVADGYRRIGPDFPTMGEHWLNVSIAVRPDVDPLHPSILEYISVSGKPVLAGVAYTQLVHNAGPKAPIPAPVTAWHFHRGSVDEESFVLSHAAGAVDTSGVGPRIAVLHAWLWLENPKGLFGTDNWALPWRRLGVVPPAWVGNESAGELAAALAAGGDRYFTTLFRYREHLTPEQGARVGALLERHGQEIRTLFHAGQNRSEPPAESTLSAAWRQVEADLGTICSACTLLASHQRH